MNVVLRCPSCGTTQAASGQCEACNEAEVRYFCTNHEPGLWLDESTCPTCAARISEARRMDSVPAPAPPVAARERSAAPARAPIAAPARAPVSVSPPPWAEAPPRPHAPPWPMTPPAAVLARPAPAALARDHEPTSLAQLGGCLMRLVLIAVVFVLGIAALLYFFGRALLG
ncbi:hypothetical protein BH09MYX1_BH09MYX1_00500 [soil metagenome]